MKNSDSKFSKEMEEKFMMELEAIDLGEESELEDSYFEAEKKRMESQIYHMKSTLLDNHVLEELRKNTEKEGVFMNQFENDVNELQKITANEQKNVIDEGKLIQIKENVKKMNNISILTLADDNVKVQKQQQLVKDNVKNHQKMNEIAYQIKKEQLIIKNKIEAANLERERLAMGRQDELSMKIQLEYLSLFFKERFIKPNIMKVYQKDTKIQIITSKPKSTFTNLKPLPNTEENVLPKNSPEIALKNLKKGKKISLKPKSVTEIKVKSKKIQENPEKIEKQKQNSQKISQKTNKNDKLEFILTYYIKQIQSHSKNINAISKDYKPKFLKHHLDEKQKNINFQFDFEKAQKLEKKQKSLSQVVSNQENVHSLKEFSLTFENITSVKGIQNFKELEYLSLQYNILNKIQQIQSCKRLIQVNLSHNKIKTLEHISSLPWLRLLNMQYNSIKQLEMKGGALQMGFFGHNSIEQIKSMSQNRNLRVLHLNNNRLNTVSGLQYLYFLQDLNLQKNVLKNLQGLQHLFLLKKLNASDNRIQQLPNPFVNLYLNELILNNNYLSKVETLYCPCLEKLFLCKNKVKSKLQSECIAYLPNLREFNADENDLQGFSFIWSMLRYSKNVEILKYNNNDYFIYLREKVRELYQYIVYKNMSNLKILNQAEVDLGLAKHYEEGYKTYLKEKDFFSERNQTLLNVEKYLGFILRESEAGNRIEASKSKFSETSTFIQHKSITKAKNLMKIVDYLKQRQNKKETNNLLIVSQSLFYSHDQYEFLMRKSLHKIRSMIVAKRYRKAKRLRYFLKNKESVINCVKNINEILKFVDLKQVIRKFEYLLKKLNQNSAAIKIQKVWKGYKARKRYLKIMKKLNKKQDSFDLQDVDTDFFNNQLEQIELDFNIEDMGMEDLIIRPEVFTLLEEREKKHGGKKKQEKSNQNKPNISVKNNAQDPLVDNYVNPASSNKIGEDGISQQERKQMQEWGFKNVETLRAMKFKQRRKQANQKKQRQANMTAAERYQRFKQNHR